MRFLAGPWRVNALSALLVMFTLATVVTTVMMTTPATARAQDGEKAPEAAKKEGGGLGGFGFIVHILASLGIFFGLIFTVLSITIVALIIILLLDLRLGESVPSAFVDDFTTMVNKRQFKQAYDLCRNDSSYLARVMTAGMGRLQYGIEDAREAMLGMVDTVRVSKDSWIAYLAMIGTVGPMLGLVGTVWGMLGAFAEISHAAGAPNAQALAGFISEALVLTLFGVGISVPAIFFFTFFKNRLSNITSNVTNLADDLLTQMYHNSKKTAGAPPATASVSVDKAPTGVQAKS